MITVNYRTMGGVAPVQPAYTPEEDEWPVEEPVLWQPASFLRVARPKREPDYIDIRKQPTPPPPNPFLQKFRLSYAIAESVGHDLRLSRDDIFGAVRASRYIDARALTAKLLSLCGISAKQIGYRMGGRDHSTILNAFDKFDIYLRRNPEMAASYERHLAMKAEADAQEDALAA